MSVKEKYGIVFHSKIVEGIKYNICDVINPNYYNLSFINRFAANETSDMIDDLNRCITHQGNSSDFYQSDSIEYVHTIQYKYPDMIIDDILIPMKDLKELLNEWLIFIR